MLQMCIESTRRGSIEQTVLIIQVLGVDQELGKGEICNKIENLKNKFKMLIQKKIDIIIFSIIHLHDSAIILFHEKIFNSPKKYKS